MINKTTIDKKPAPNLLYRQNKNQQNQEKSSANSNKKISSNINIKFPCKNNQKLVLR